MKHFGWVSWCILALSLVVGHIAAQQDSTKVNTPTFATGSGVSDQFTEIEQLKIINAYRKQYQSGKAFGDANCQELAVSANTDATEYNKLLASIKKAHSIDPSREITLDLKADTVKVNPKPEPKK